MNSLESARSSLRNCPIPENVQDLIFSMLLSFGTPSSGALMSSKLIVNDDIPIAVVILGTLDRCRHTLYYANKTISHFYDNAGYFSRRALFETHIVYLKKKKVQTPTYTTSKIAGLTYHLHLMTRNRLLKFIEEERRLEAQKLKV